MDVETRLKRLRFRAWHRGTREADMLVGGFFDTYSTAWTPGEIDLFEVLIEEPDADILAWAMDMADVPERYRGPMMAAMQKLDYITVLR